jgi:DUF1680 family protein
MTSIRPLGLSEARVTGGFWAGKMDMVARDMLPYQWLALNDEVPGAEPSHAVENFRIAAGEDSGEFKGNIWQDSDVAKWLEASCYSLVHHPDPGLAAQVEEAVRLIAKAQRPDGYVNSYFIVKSPDARWKDIAWGHELYCAGHLFEAAVAHHWLTGKPTLLDVARRYADCIDAAFGPEEGKIHASCGHPEVELGLYRLFRETGEDRYRALASYFIRERGRDPQAFVDKEPLGFEIPIKAKAFRADYFQGQAPIVDQEAAEGHAVRAMYLYAAAAEECLVSGDPAMRRALRRLWDSAVSRRMYVTGGIGSQAQAERFTTDFDLPSDTAYAETCASIGMAFWASRMALLEEDSRYADVVERVLYNVALSGVSLDGKRYFYVNPLELRPRIASCRQDHEHVKAERVAWLGCACCPPNIARLVASVASYLYALSGDAVIVNQYARSEAEFEAGVTSLRLRQETDFPWSGAVSIEVDPGREVELCLKLRIPLWCESYSCSVNGRAMDPQALESGYLAIRRRWKAGDRVELGLEMRPRLLRADPRIPELAGKVAVQRGPMVYCAEEIDNGPDLHLLAIDPEAELEAELDPGLMGGSVRVIAQGFREDLRSMDLRSMDTRRDVAPNVGSGDRGPGSPPYNAIGSGSPRRGPVKIAFVPYHQWGNRQPGAEMAVWLRGLDRISGGL